MLGDVIVGNRQGDAERSVGARCAAVTGNIEQQARDLAAQPERGPDFAAVEHPGDLVCELARQRFGYRGIGAIQFPEIVAREPPYDGRGQRHGAMEMAIAVHDHGRFAEAVSGAVYLDQHVTAIGVEAHQFQIAILDLVDSIGPVARRLQCLAAIDRVGGRTLEQRRAHVDRQFRDPILIMHYTCHAATLP